MVTPDDIKRKVEDLARRVEVVKRKKVELAALVRAKKAELATVVQEIKAAGGDPRKLGAEALMAQRDLEAMLASYERNLVATEQALGAPVAPREHPASELLPDQAIRDALDLASVTTPAWRRGFLEFVRGVAGSRRVVLGDLKKALERGDDVEALRLARQLVGLEDAGPRPAKASDRPSRRPSSRPRPR